MKTPEEIKKELFQDIYLFLRVEDGNIPQERFVELIRLHNSAFAYIQQLESRLAQAERERDAAVHDLKLVRCCGTCVNNEGGCTTECNIVSGVPSGWQWRGVCAENTEEDSP